MLGSLRFRLPAVFLLGIALAVLVAALISIRFFQNYTQARGVDELRAESAGIVQLYTTQAGRETVPVSSLVNALGGDQLYWLPAFRGSTLLQGLTDLPPGATSVDVRKLKGSATVNVTIAKKHYLAVVRPLRLGQNLFGALVVAKPTSQLRSRTILLVERLTLAFGGAVIVAGLFGLYLSRRIAEPLTKSPRGTTASRFPSRAETTRSRICRCGSPTWRPSSRSRSSFRGTSSCRSRTSCARR
jgi:hypothetical protein